MKFCVTDFWIPKLHMTGVSKFLAIKFVEKFFQFFLVGFERNLHQILRFFKIEIVNTKSQPTGVKKNFTYIPWGLNQSIKIIGLSSSKRLLTTSCSLPTK